MDQMRFDEMLGDVAKHFKQPADIVDAEDLTKQQKCKLLQQWDYDLQLLLTASEENMTGGGTDATATTADTVTQLRNAMKELGVERDPDATGPAKIGSPVDKTANGKTPAEKSTGKK